MPSSKHKPSELPLSQYVLVSQRLEIKASLTLTSAASLFATDAEEQLSMRCYTYSWAWRQAVSDVHLGGEELSGHGQKLFPF